MEKHVSSGLSPEEYVAFLKDQQKQAAPESRVPQHSPASSSDFPFKTPTSAPKRFSEAPARTFEAEHESIDRAKVERRRQRRPLSQGQKRLIGGVATVAGLALIVGVVHNVDPEIGQSFLESGQSSNIAEAKTPVTTKIKKVGIAALKCGTGNESIITASVSGYLPVDPEFINAKGQIVGEATPYLTKKNVNLLPQSQQAAAAKLVTSDHLPHIDAQNLELALNICDPSTTNATLTVKGKTVESVTIVNNTNNNNTINNIIADFSDPNQEFQLGIAQLPVVPQTNGEIVSNLKTNQLQYFTAPATTDLGIQPSTVPAADLPLLAPLEKAMTQPTQYEALEAVIEEDIVDELSTASSSSTISFSNGASSLMGLVTDALQKSLLPNPNVALNLPETFNFKANVQLNANKAYLTSKDVIGLDIGKFHITSAKVVEGTEVNPYQPAATPSPTPTSTPTEASPTPTPTAKK